MLITPKLTRRSLILGGVGVSVGSIGLAQPQVGKGPTLPNGLAGAGAVLAAAHGDRFTKRGKERLTIIGTSLTVARGQLGMRLTYELPGKLKYEETSGRGNSLVISGPGTAASKSAADDDDDDLLESLFYDSPDYFFSSASEASSAPRRLGGRFRTSNGQLVDLFQMVVPLSARRNAEQRTKFYGFDSSTGLLSRVRSNVTRGNGRAQVDTEWTEWRVVDGQQVPGRMRRIENGAERANVIFSAPVFSPLAADATFTKV